MNRCLALVVAVAVSVSGCSVFANLSPGGPASPRHAPADCDHSTALILDTVTAAVALGLTGVFAVVDETHPHTDFGFSILDIVTVPIGTVYGAAALYGARKNNECRDANRDRAALAAGASPQFYCTASATDDIGSCSTDAAVCARERDVFAARSHDMSACAPQLFASCFRYRADGVPRVACAPTSQACYALQQAAEGQPRSSAVEACEETR